MLRLVTIENCKDLPATIQQLRETFSTVFARHYANIICEAVKNKDQERLTGFGDVIAKHFENNISKFSYKQIVVKLKKLYSGPGFDDEAAFLLGFNGFDKSNVDAATWFNTQAATLTPPQQQEIVDYLSILNREDRTLSEVNFLALVDKKDQVHGFCIYHLLQKGDQLILHVRQAAIVNQNVGYARVFSRYLVDHYPHAFYEANQRNANTVPMKQMLLMEGLLTSGPAVLGYSDKYVALLSSTRLRPMYFSHYLKKEKNDDVQQLSDSGIKSLGLRCHGQYWEAESVAERAFSPLRFFKEVNGDDLYLGRFSKNENDNKHYYSEQERVYIKTPKFQI